jgi:hypothetical protein
MPAMTERRVASFSSAATFHCVTSFLMSSQSETTKPLKPSSPRRMSVRICLLTWPGTPLISAELTITVRAPALTAAAKVGRKNSRR